jgi:hypothetical protein
MMGYYTGTTSNGTTWNGEDTTSNWDNNIPTKTYFDDGVISRIREEIRKFERSRNWLRAPLKILPAFSLKIFVMFNRKIAPAFWTGKNFKKVKC